MEKAKNEGKIRDEETGERQRLNERERGKGEVTIQEGQEGKEEKRREAGKKIEKES